jgi:hypothetical protein
MMPKDVNKMSADEKLEYLRSLLAPLLRDTLQAVRERWGQEGVEYVADYWRKSRENSTGHMLHQSEAQHSDVRGVAEIFDYNDANFYGAPDAHWETLTSTYGKKIVKSCAIAKYFSPDICKICFRDAALGIGRKLTGNNNFRVTVPKAIPSGDDHCEIILESPQD